MQFIKRSFVSALVIGCKAAGNILVNKLISSYFQNPQLFAVLAHFQNLLGIFSSVPSDGVNQGAIKYLAGKDLDDEDSKKMFYAGLWLNGLIFLGSIGALFILKGYFISVFSIGMNPFIWFVLISAVLLIQLLNSYFLSLILSQQQIQLFALINIVSTFLGVVLVYASIEFFTFPMVLIAAGFGPSSLFFVTAFLIHIFYFPLLKIKLPDADSLKKLGGFIMMALSIMLFSKVVDFIVREYAMSAFTIYETGLWQSVVKFSDYYMAAFVSLAGMAYYPKLSQLVNDKKALRIYLREVLRIVIPFFIFGLMTVYFLREYILVLFFDEHFREGEKYFVFQLTGDFFKMISFTIGYIITAQARTVLFIGSQAASAIIYAGLIMFLTNQLGMEGFPLAHALRYLLFSIYIVVLYRKIIF